MKTIETQRRKMPKSGKVKIEAEFSNYMGERVLFNKLFVGRLLALAMSSFKIARKMGTEFHADTIVEVLVVQLGLKTEYEAMYAQIEKDFAEGSKNNAVPEPPDKVKYMYEKIEKHVEKARKSK